MKQLIIGCGIASILVVLAGAALIYYVFVRELPVLDATLDAPHSVTLDSEFEIVVTATNPHAESVTLDSIDIQQTFLDGFQVVGVTPEPVDTMNVFGMIRTWEFGIPVAPGDSTEIRFEFRAVEEGRFSGDLDVCNPNQDWKTLVPDIVVKRETPDEAPAEMPADSEGDADADSPDPERTTRRSVKRSPPSP